MAPFQPGNKLAPGGKREGAGRKKWADKRREQLTVETFEQIIRKHTAPLAKLAVNRAYESDAVLNKLVDKFWPNGEQEQQAGDTHIHFHLGDSSIEPRDITPGLSQEELEPAIDSGRLYIGGNGGKG